MKTVSSVDRVAQTPAAPPAMLERMNTTRSSKLFFSFFTSLELEKAINVNRDLDKIFQGITLDEKNCIVD